jgi:hypothetical protein
MLSVVMLNVVMLSFNILSGTVLSIVMLGDTTVLEIGLDVNPSLGTSLGS